MKKITTKIMMAMGASLITASVFAQTDTTKPPTPDTTATPDTTVVTDSSKGKPQVSITSQHTNATASVYYFEATNKETALGRKTQQKEIEKEEA